MIEYKRHIEEYFNYMHSSFSKLIPQNEWGNKKLAEEYLQRYWLTNQDYFNVWKPIQDRIFIQNNCFPDLVFLTEFKILALKGGCLFVEEDFKKLQQIMIEIGESYFVIVQQSQDFTEGEPMFRMKFPVNISWSELTNGNYIAAVLFEMSYNEYVVFGASEKWGKYSANDYKYPLDIFGFKPEYVSIFTNIFEEYNKKIVHEMLPPQYEGLVL